MSVQVSASFNFTADDRADAIAAVEEMTFPSGAQVILHVEEPTKAVVQMTMDHVDTATASADGKIVITDEQPTSEPISDEATGGAL